MKDAIVALENHEPTDVICVISKPPAKEVRDEVVQLLQSISKPVVAIFLGENLKPMKEKFTWHTHWKKLHKSLLI